MILKYFLDFKEISEVYIVLINLQSTTIIRKFQLQIAMLNKERKKNTRFRDVGMSFYGYHC